MRRFLKSIAVYLLTAEARGIIRTYKPSIIAVTGSVGKTSTKDAIYAALADTLFIRKSEKSFNSDIGLPLTILGAPNAWRSPLRWIQNIFDGLLLNIVSSRYPDWLVLEVGADRPGDIQKIARWLPVDIAVITRLPEVPVHVEYFDSPEQVIEEKASLLQALKPSGTILLYGDDERVQALSSRVPGARALTFGFGPHCDVRAEDLTILYEDSGEPKGMRAVVISGAEHMEANLQGTIGAHMFLPLLCAVAVGQVQGINLQKIVSSFEKNYVPPPGRMRILPGIKHTLIIDDSYNASPAAVHAGLEVLRELTARGRKIAVLGDMLELGKYSVEEHKKMGILAAQAADILVTVGVRARDAAEAALDAGLFDERILQYEDADKAGAELAVLAKEGDVIYIKGSQSMRMEKAVKELVLDASHTKNLLVRQEFEWGKRH